MRGGLFIPPPSLPPPSFISPPFVTCHTRVFMICALHSTTCWWWTKLVLLYNQIFLSSRTIPTTDNNLVSTVVLNEFNAATSVLRLQVLYNRHLTPFSPFLSPYLFLFKILLALFQLFISLLLYFPLYFSPFINWSPQPPSPPSHLVTPVSAVHLRTHVRWIMLPKLMNMIFSTTKHTKFHWY